MPPGATRIGRGPDASRGASNFEHELRSEVGENREVGKIWHPLNERSADDGYLPTEGVGESSPWQQHDAGTAASSLLRQFASAELGERARLQVPLLDALRALSPQDAGQLLLATALRDEAATPHAELHAALMFTRHDDAQSRWQLADAHQHIAILERRVAELQEAVERAADGISLASSGAHDDLAHERGDAITLARADVHEREAFELSVQLQAALERLATTERDLARSTALLNETAEAHARDALELQSAVARLARAESGMQHASALLAESNDARGA